MTPSAAYLSLIEALAGDIARRSAPGLALRVGIDGQTAAGKTSFARALHRALNEIGREVVRAELDSFHNSRAIRYRQGRSSARGYYEDGRDLDAVRRLLLDPIGPGGDGRYALASFDLEGDTALEPDWQQASPGMILLFDGSFLQKPALRAALDLVIFLHVADGLAAARGAARDKAMLGDQAEALYRDRYSPAFELYRAEVDPVASADIVVDMSDFEAPALLKAPF